MGRFAWRLARRGLTGAFGGGVAFLGYDLATENRCDDSGQTADRTISDIIVVGGGVAGVTSAYFLSRQGFKVTILEKGPQAAPATSASSLNAGWGRRASRRPATTMANLQLAAWSAVSPEGSQALSVWPSQFLLNVPWVQFGFRYVAACLHEGVTAATTDTFSKLTLFSSRIVKEVAEQEQWDPSEWSSKHVGLTQLCLSQEKFDAAKKEAETNMTDGFKIDVLEQQEARAAVGSAAFSKDLVGLTKEHDGFSGDCGRFAEKMVRCCVEKFGAQFLPDTEVKELCVERNRVTGVRTTDGRSFSADAVVLANGAWAPTLAETADVWLPIIPMRGYSLEVPRASRHSKDLEELFDKFPNVLFPHCKLAVTGFTDAENTADPLRIRFTSVAEFMPVDAPQSEAMQRYLTRHATTLYPALREVILSSDIRVGSRPQTPDDLPIVSGTRYPNLFVNVGGCSYGWRWSCGSAAMLSALISQSASRADMPELEALSLRRFKWRPFLQRSLLSTA